MIIYSGKRRSGKTTMLIKQSSETDAIIVTSNYHMVKDIECMAKSMGLNIPTPITLTNYINQLAYGGLGKTQKYLVDELQMMLYQMNVDSATIDADHVKELITND